MVVSGCTPSLARPTTAFSEQNARLQNGPLFGFMPMSHIPNELTSYDSGKLPNFKWIETLAKAVSG